MLNDLPTGTITFLFTDIEGSTQLWERYPERMKAALARHDDLLRQAIEARNGRVVKTTGDGCHAVFSSPVDAVATAITCQQTFQVDAPFPFPLLVRMGLHSGEAEVRDGDYFGSAVNRAARIMSIGHGGQVLISATTAALIRDALPPEASLRDLGEHRLRDLARPSHIYQVVIEGLRNDFPPLRSLNAYPGNLPVQLTSFIGREHELAEVEQLLATTRLLTLTGPGGTGKTRLSLQAAANLQEGYPHGAWLVELAPLSDEALVPDAVAALFSLSKQPGTSLLNALVDYLRGKQMLLILDNCEHLVAASAQLAVVLLANAPRLTILASSREGLGIAGETTYHVPTLTLPSPADITAAAVCRYDAANLFLQRARAANPGFIINDGNAPSIAQIVRRLDGIPLAIELAAARTRLLTPAQIAARLDDRFRLLTGGSRTALPRQQTLRALIDWSYDLLDESEQWFFRQMGVFVGGWTLEAAEAVTGSTAEIPREDVLDLLDEMVNKSLVGVDAGEIHTRYHFLETVRQYARDKLFESGEGLAARDRHMDYYRDILLSEDLLDNDGSTVSVISYRIFYFSSTDKGLEHDLENMRAAIEWAMKTDPERALAMASKLAMALTMSRMSAVGIVNEALSIVEKMPLPEDEQAIQERLHLLCVAQTALGFGTMGLGDLVLARQHLEQAISLARATGNRRYLAASLAQRSLTGMYLNEDDTVEEGREAADLYREMKVPMGEAQGLGQISQFYFQRGDIERALPLAEKALAIVRAQGSADSAAYSMTLLAMAQLARLTGDIDLAEAQLRSGAEAFRRKGNRLFAAIQISNLGHMLRQAGRTEAALIEYRLIIREWQDLGRRAAVANLLENFAFIARVGGQLHRASRLLGAAETIREEIQVDMTPWERQEYEREIAALRNELPTEVLAREWAAGQTLTLDEAVDYAVEDRGG